MIVEPFKLLFYSFIINTVCCQACFNPNFSLFQNIKSSGFHRVLQWNISSDQAGEIDGCLYSLIVTIPTGMFVNPEEIAELNRKNLIDAYLDGSVDIEAPEHESNQHNVYLFFNWKEVKNIIFSLPVHLRYHRATFKGGFTEVNLQQPTLLAKCSSIPIFCEMNSKVRTFCNSNGITRCIWNNISYQGVFEDSYVFVPIGNLNHYSFVAISTLILGCLGCIYLLTVSKKRKIE